MTSMPTQQWIEVFHSKPSMRYCYLLEKLPDATFSNPSPENRLRDASHIREGFRVFRLPFRRIEFVLTNGTNRNWEDNNGNNYVIDVPGRYVVEHGIRRVADADAAECYQTVCRPNDRHIQLSFRADLWQQCYCSFQSDDNEWTEPPGKPMKLVPRQQQGRYFELVVEASRMACAFNDGGENWDSRLNNNYLIGCPGKYEVSGGSAKYVSPSDKDLQAMPATEKVSESASPTLVKASPALSAVVK